MYSSSSYDDGVSEGGRDKVVLIDRVVGIGANYGLIDWRVHWSNVTENEIRMSME
jgi:hypothetical protein